MKKTLRFFWLLLAAFLLFPAGCQKKETAEPLLTEGMENCAIEPTVGMANPQKGDTTRTAVFTTLKVPRSEKITALLEKEKTDWLKQAQKALEEDETLTSIESTMEVTYNQAGLLSILRTESRVRKDAAAPNLLYSARTFSIGREQELSAADLLLTDGKPSKPEDILQMVTESFYTLISENPQEYQSDAKDTLKTAAKDYGFYLSVDQTVFFLPAESVAPHAAGMTTFGLPFSNTDLYAVKIPEQK